MSAASPSPPSTPSDLLAAARVEDAVEKAAALLSDNRFAQIDASRVPAYHRELPGKKYELERELFDRTVNAAWMAHTTDKGVTPGAIVAEDPELPIEQVRRILATPRFKEAAKLRGIPDPDMNHLTSEMVAALHVLSDSSLMLDSRQRLKRIGVGWNEYQGWLQYKPFKDAHAKMMRRTLDIANQVGDRVLAQKIEAGDLNAIKFSYEMTGKFVPGTQQQASVGYVLGVVLSVLKRNLTDPELLTRVSQEILSVATGNGVPEPLILEATVLEPDVNDQHDEPRDDPRGPGNEPDLLDGGRQR